jgi:hypothetical protein
MSPRSLIVVGLIGRHFWDRRGDILEPNGGPVVTVMDFGQSLPLGPLPSGWRTGSSGGGRRWRCPLRHGRGAGSKLAIPRRCCFTPSISFSPRTRSSSDAGTLSSLSAARSTSAHARAPSRLFLRFLTDRGESTPWNTKRPSWAGLPPSREDDVRSDRHKRPRRKKVRGRPLDERSHGTGLRGQGRHGPTPRVGSRRRCENWDCRAG